MWIFSNCSHFHLSQNIPTFTSHADNMNSESCDLHCRKSYCSLLPDNIHFNFYGIIQLKNHVNYFKWRVGSHNGMVQNSTIIEAVDFSLHFIRYKFFLLEVMEMDFLSLFHWGMVLILKVIMFDIGFVAKSE